MALKFISFLAVHIKCTVVNNVFDGKLIYLYSL